jgi:hypothetical protein
MGKEREGRTILYNEDNSRILSKTDSVVDSVIDKLIERAKVGKTKYNTDLDRGDLTIHKWLTHLQEELLDAANYVEKLKQLLGSPPKS